ncbi:MAG TPA: amidohydrolase [Chthoniobacterales bacterium]|nr:amidohydrolase [Chthoniobacterales bacterium]
MAPAATTTVFVNANVYTGGNKQPHAEAIGVEDDHIIFVGSASSARDRLPEAKVIDLQGKTVVPGLTDSHCHIFGIGEREMRLNLEGTNTREDFLQKIAERVKQTAPGKWVVGRGWIETFWKPPHFPTRQDLDAIAPDNPVYLTRADGHASVVNSAALRIAGIDQNTADPFGGQILKDQTGQPNGMLLDNAQAFVEKNIPDPTEADRDKALVLGVEREIKLGWCEIHNAGSHPADIDLIRKGYESRNIKLRIYNAVYGPGEAAKQLLVRGSSVDQYGKRFTQRTIKVMFDGAVGSRGAALLKPYHDSPETSGYLTAKPEELRPMFKEALRRGIQVETHAIGDRANRIILDLYEEAFNAVPADQRMQKNPRWRVEHAQNLDAADIPRFAKLRVIASMQPSHAISDLFFAPARLGMERLTGAYAWQSLLKSGVGRPDAKHLQCLLTRDRLFRMPARLRQGFGGQAFAI